MIHRTTCGWTAMALAGLLVGAANADDGGPVRAAGPAPTASPAPAGNALPASTTNGGPGTAVTFDAQGGPSTVCEGNCDDGSAGAAGWDVVCKRSWRITPLRVFVPP